MSLLPVKLVQHIFQHLPEFPNISANLFNKTVPYDMILGSRKLSVVKIY